MVEIESIPDEEKEKLCKEDLEATEDGWQKLMGEDLMMKVNSDY